MDNLPKFLIVFGFSLAALGLFLTVFLRLPGFERLGEMPGNLFPFAACVFLSLSLTGGAWLLQYFRSE